MSFPSGQPGGYQGRPPQQPSAAYVPPPAALRTNPLAELELPTIVTLAVLVLALASYFCSFTSGASGLGIQVMVLLAGGLLAGLSILPKAPKTLPFGAVLSTIGGLSVLAAVIESSGGGSTPTITIIILILGLLQFLASAFALLLDYELIKLAPKSAVPYGNPGSFGQSGPFPAQQHHGQAPPQQAPQGQPAGAPGAANQATHYVAAPPQQQPPTPQSTMFMQQPGQISQQQNPGTPPGGFPGES